MANIEMYISDAVDLRAVVKDILGAEYPYGSVFSPSWDWDNYDGEFSLAVGSPDTLTAQLTADHPSWQNPGEVRFKVLPYSGAASTVAATPITVWVKGASQILPYHERHEEGVWSSLNSHVVDTGDIGTNPSSFVNGSRRLRADLYDAIGNSLGIGAGQGAKYSFDWTVDDATVVGIYYDTQYDADHCYFKALKPGRTTIRVVGTPGFETQAGTITGEWEVIVMGVVSAEIERV